ncbi:hypothetical protein ACFWUW_06910 [Streptomyces sp. NPDC058655]|uniref:hypothetical protein n=1 Tax=unclassified Streptomyces TaxID=2593676 RepID=UPI003658C71C
MAVKKATMQQQVAEAIALINPADRPLVTLHVAAGPSVWLMSMLGALGQLFITPYFITVTEQAVVVHKASRWSNRPQEIAFAIPASQAGGLVSGINRNAIWSNFRLQLPNQPKPTRMNVHRIWRAEMDQVLTTLTAQPAV